MQYDRVIHQAAREVQTILEARRVPEMRAMELLREIISRPLVEDALARGNDIALSFILRAIKHVVIDQELPPAGALSQLRSIAVQLELKRTLQVAQLRQIDGRATGQGC